MSAADAAADRCSDHHRRRILSAGTIPVLRELADDLIERRKDEIRELDLRDRAHAIKRHADCRADDPTFRQRRVDRSLGAKLFVETFGCAKDAAELADVFTE